MEETGKEYDIIFLIRPDNDITTDRPKDEILKWVENHEDVLYSSSKIKTTSTNPTRYYVSDSYLSATPKIIGNIIKKLPDMRNFNFDYNNPHHFLSEHLINLSYIPTDDTPFRSYISRPNKNIKKLI